MLQLELLGMKEDKAKTAVYKAKLDSSQKQKCLFSLREAPFGEATSGHILFTHAISTTAVKAGLESPDPKAEAWAIFYLKNQFKNSQNIM